MVVAGAGCTTPPEKIKGERRFFIGRDGRCVEWQPELRDVPLSGQRETLMREAQSRRPRRRGGMSTIEDGWMEMVNGGIERKIG